jgi:glyoxylase-like metal-dependent hydrolase (beta-lactamase superfamily II)
VLIPAGNPSLWTGPTGNNTYLLRGAVPALVDAGIGRPAHVAAIADALGAQALAVLLITHDHPDHTGGVPALLERWPDALVRNYRSDACRDGEVIEAGDSRLEAVHTPGHAPDHFSFYDGRSGDLYCGDLARAGGTIVIPARRGGHLGQYLASLRRVRALGPARLLPGHGPIIDDPAAVIDGYLRHREEREAQIVEALRAGLEAEAALLARVYGPLPSALVRAAGDSLLAHLVKLEEEGRAARTEGGWRLI